MSMPPVLTEAASSRSRTTKSEKQKAISPSKVLEEIEQHVLLDGFKIVIDLDKSRGPYLYNAVTNKPLIDFYGFFGSMPVGFNHPHFDDPAVQRDLLRAAKVKIANSDVYSEGYAEFVETFERVVGLPPLERYLFIEGGAPAVENCLKAAMDWKVRKNMAAGHGERGTQVLHFRRAFHGRSGYTMSLTNTDPRKTDLFAKFDWPRVSCPHIDFSLPESEREADVIAREQKAEQRDPALHRPAGDRHLRHHHRADPGRRRRQSFPRRMAAEIANDLRRERDASHLRRSAVRHGCNGPQLVLRTFQCYARSDGLWEKGAGVRRDGRAAPR